MLFNLQICAIGAWDKAINEWMSKVSALYTVMIMNSMLFS